MIGPAVRALLLTSTEVKNLVGENISPIRFTQSIPTPGLMYATDNIRPDQSCRDSVGVYVGTLEISMLDKRYLGIDALMTAVRGVLDNFAGTSKEWFLQIQPGIEGPDDYDEVINAYYKRLDFTITAEKAS
jgi:hypothetical protein